MGVKNAVEESKGSVAFTCLLVVINILEAFNCLVDIINMSQHFIPLFGHEAVNDVCATNTRLGRDHRSSIVAEAENSQRRVRQTNGSSRTIQRAGGGIQSARSETARQSQRSNRQSEQRSTTLSSRRRRNENDSMRSTRSRENRREGRDSSLLHPVHAHMRHRGRRRPILRGQNHYVLVPAPISRSRTFSRGGRTRDRRTQGDVPMFIIPNHDRYIRALNQSIDTEETRQNRGSVPADVVNSVSNSKPSDDSPDKSKTDINPKPTLDGPHTDASDKVEVVSEGGRRRSSRDILMRKDSPVYKVEDSPTTMSGNSSENKAKSGPGKRSAASMYSVVRRSKDGSQVKPDIKAMEMKEMDAPHVSTISSLQNSLASKLSRVAAVVMNGQKENTPMGIFKTSQPLNSEVACSLPPPTPDSLPDRDLRPMNLGESGHSFTQLYTTSSEGEYSTISIESEAASDTPRDIAPLNSVSSDSGLGEIPGNSNTRSSNYYNLPPYGVPRTSVDFSSVCHGSPRFYPPVSPRTPAYENIDMSSASPPNSAINLSAFPFTP